MSSWYISNKGVLVCDGSKSLGLKILHLEDHNLFHTGFRNAIDKFLPEPAYAHFNCGIDALEYYKRTLENGQLPDIIISDINHPGLNGKEFVKALREAEKDHRVRTPVMILSMVDPSCYSELVNEKMVDHCLTKAASVEEIVEGIKKILSD